MVVGHPGGRYIAYDRGSVHGDEWDTSISRPRLSVSYSTGICQGCLEVFGGCIFHL
jgi:hypothetical protein